MENYAISLHTTGVDYNLLFAFHQTANFPLLGIHIGTMLTKGTAQHYHGNGMARN
jgi:hypothetical protein